jgi:hypothetical protein
MWFVQTSFVGLFALVLLSSSVSFAKDKEAKNKASVKPLLNSAVSAKQKIRFYKANRELQSTAILLTDEKSSSAGCQNFLKKVRVFKVVQIGFANCTLYAEKECPVATSVAATSEDQAHTTTLLGEGVGWFPEGDSERGATVKSWSCDQTVGDGQVALEARNARREMARLNQEAQAKERKAAEAREKANQAQKAADKAKEYANRVKAYAIATGAIKPDPKEDEEGKGGKNNKKGDKQKGKKEATD